MHTITKSQLAATVRAEAITADGIHVLIEAHGPGTTLIERAEARVNHALWTRGYRPDQHGHWRKA